MSAPLTLQEILNTIKINDYDSLAEVGGSDNPDLVYPEDNTTKQEISIDDAGNPNWTITEENPDLEPNWNAELVEQVDAEDVDISEDDNGSDEEEEEDEEVEESEDDGEKEDDDEFEDDEAEDGVLEEVAAQDARDGELLDMDLDAFVAENVRQASQDAQDLMANEGNTAASLQMLNTDADELPESSLPEVPPPSSLIPSPPPLPTYRASNPKPFKRPVPTRAMDNSATDMTIVDMSTSQFPEISNVTLSNNDSRNSVLWGEPSFSDAVFLDDSSQIQDNTETIKESSMFIESLLSEPSLVSPEARSVLQASNREIQTELSIQEALDRTIQSTTNNEQAPPVPIPTNTETSEPIQLTNIDQISITELPQEIRQDLESKVEDSNQRALDTIDTAIDRSIDDSAYEINVEVYNPPMKPSALSTMFVSKVPVPTIPQVRAAAAKEEAIINYPRTVQQRENLKLGLQESISNGTSVTFLANNLNNTLGGAYVYVPVAGTTAEMSQFWSSIDNLNGNQLQLINNYAQASELSVSYQQLQTSGSIEEFDSSLDQYRRILPSVPTFNYRPVATNLKPINPTLRRQSANFNYQPRQNFNYRAPTLV